MDKDKLLQLLSNKEVRKYGFDITFFVMFSFFLIFAIRPNLITAFSLQKELQDLKIKNKESEAVILQVVNYQSTLEEYRDKIPLLDQAVPSTPTIAQVVDEIRKSASDSGILLHAVSVESIDLKGEQESEVQTQQSDAINEEPTQEATKGINSFSITISGVANINQANVFLDKLMNQRRLKKIDSVTLTQEENGSTSIVIIIYYL